MADLITQVPIPNTPMVVPGTGVPVKAWFDFFTTLWLRTGGISNNTSVQLDLIGAIRGGMLARFASEWREFEATVANTIPVMSPLADVRLLTIAQLLAGPSVPIVGASMAADYIFGSSLSVLSALSEAGLWPAGKIYNGVLIAKTFDASQNSAGPNLAPNVANFVYAKNDGVNNDVVAILSDVLVNANNCTGFGANFIARNNAGIIGAKLVGCELDVEFAAGSVAGAGTAGLYINIFSAAAAGPAIQTGGHVGGTWNNGIVLDGLEALSSAGLAPNAGSSLGALINTGVATYGMDAVIFSNTHKLRFSGTAGVDAKMYVDAADFFHIVNSSAGIAFRDNTDTTSILTIANDGTVTTGTASAFKSTGPVNALAFTAMPAGGTAGSGVILSSTANFGVFFGSGAPTLSAAKGSLYLRSDGSGVNDRMYVNTNSGTTWTAVTTVA